MNDFEKFGAAVGKLVGSFVDNVFAPITGDTVSSNQISALKEDFLRQKISFFRKQNPQIAKASVTCVCEPEQNRWKVALFMLDAKGKAISCETAKGDNGYYGQVLYAKNLDAKIIARLNGQTTGVFELAEIECLTYKELLDFYCGYRSKDKDCKSSSIFCVFEEEGQVYRVAQLMLNENGMALQKENGHAGRVLYAETLDEMIRFRLA
ncbi:MAG: hypothetical protein J6A23_13840, partial [Thermoguttaceae bacterium]|nr:hypothetical protein [Thermoguttaceae bacterium]